MAGLKASQFLDAGALQASDIVPVVRDNVNYKTTADQFLAAVGSGFTSVATRAAMAATNPAQHPYLMLTESKREGVFEFFTAAAYAARWQIALTVAVAADTQQGVHVAAASDPTGAAGAWVRVGDILTPYMFGAATNYKTGNRETLVPPYGESQTPGSIDGILVDSRVACQAMIDTIALHDNRHFVGDFSGGLWGISKRNDAGAYTLNGLVFDFRNEQRPTFIGGSFRAIGSGDSLLYVRGASHAAFPGVWNIQGGPDVGSGYGWATRTWNNGLWVRDCGMAQWGELYVASFKRFGIQFDPEYNLADYNNNIGCRFKKTYIGACGSRPEAAGYFLQINYTGATNTGSAMGFNQRTNLPLDPAGGHEILQVNDIIQSPAGTYHTIMEKVGATISVFPWIIAPPANGTIKSVHGGGMSMPGKDVAGAGSDNHTGIGCGVSLDVSNELHGTSFGTVILEGSTIGVLCGTPNGIAGMGITIDHAHAEGTILDILSVGAGNVGLNILSVSAWSDQDYADVFKKCKTMYPNDGTALTVNIGMPQVSIFIEGGYVTSGITTSNDGVSTTSRALVAVISNNPNHRIVHKVLSAGQAFNCSLKYYQSIDRNARDCFFTELELVEAGGVAPTGAITITIDATDFGSGIQFANGTTTQTYVIAAGAAYGPVRLGFWLDTSGATLRWVVVPLSGVTPLYQVQTKTAGYTATETSGDIVVKCDLAAGFTVVLPTAVGNRARFTFKKIQAAGQIVIDGQAAETLDGALTATLNNQYESITIISDNSNWMII